MWSLSLLRLLRILAANLASLSLSPNSAHETVVVRRAHLTLYIPVGLAGELTHEFFRFRIPGQRATRAHCDCPQMAHGRLAMPGFDIADRCLPRAYAIEEVLHMIGTAVELHRSLGQRRF